MAGIVAAETDNAFGVAGTAYAGVSVLPITVLGADGTGQDTDIIAGVVHAADADADVILMAFSNPGFSAALQAAIDYAWDSGSVLVAATGNDGVSSATFPAGDRGVIGVTSTDASDAARRVRQSRPGRLHGRPRSRHPDDDLVRPGHRPAGRRGRQHLRHLGGRCRRRRRRSPARRERARAVERGRRVAPGAHD